MSKVNVTIGVDNRVVPSGGNKDQVLTKASGEDYDFTWADAGSGGGGSISPAQGPPDSDTPGGVTGENDNYAREDHAHPLNVDDTALPKMDGVASVGNSGEASYNCYSRANHVHPHDTFNDGLILLESANIFDDFDDLPDAGHAGRIAFVKITS